MISIETRNAVLGEFRAAASACPPYAALPVCSRAWGELRPATVVRDGAGLLPAMADGPSVPNGIRADRGVEGVLAVLPVQHVQIDTFVKQPLGSPVCRPPV